MGRLVTTKGEAGHRSAKPRRISSAASPWPRHLVKPIEKHQEAPTRRSPAEGLEEIQGPQSPIAAGGGKGKRGAQAPGRGTRLGGASGTEAGERRSPGAGDVVNADRAWVEFRRGAAPRTSGELGDGRGLGRVAGGALRPGGQRFAVPTPASANKPDKALERPSARMRIWRA